eukprot:8805695-Pyramimonas_sp.AAC.1
MAVQKSANGCATDPLGIHEMLSLLRSTPSVKVRDRAHVCTGDGATTFFSVSYTARFTQLALYRKSRRYLPVQTHVIPPTVQDRKRTPMVSD